MNCADNVLFQMALKCYYLFHLDSADHMPPPSSLHQDAFGVDILYTNLVRLYDGADGRIFISASCSYEDVDPNVPPASINFEISSWGTAVYGITNELVQEVAEKWPDENSDIADDYSFDIDVSGVLTVSHYVRTPTISDMNIRDAVQHLLNEIVNTIDVYSICIGRSL